MRILPVLTMLAACLVLPPHATAQGTSEAGTATAVATATPIRVDGKLDDAAWAEAPPITGFVQREPNEGVAPAFRTEARVAYDASAIYIAVHAFDPEPDRIVGYLTRRDSSSSSEWIHVFIDSYHDRRTAYSFSLNPAGVKQDSYWFNDDNNDSSWDAVWDGVAMRANDGWIAEFRIPRSQLRFSIGGDGRLGFAIARIVSRLNETSTWPLVARSRTGFVSQFGVLQGVSDARTSSSKRLELVPYTVGQVLTSPAQPGNPLHQSPDPGASVGVDLKYAITPALSLNATVNPDFGQVEADPAVVNLGAFETFFNERRPFFVEGSGTYQFPCFDCTLFYSRRIGRQPRGVPAIDDGEYAVRPAQSTILGAGKVTGRVGAFSVGALAAVTQEESARVASPIGRRSEVIEPGTFYSVSRARREFTDQSSLGFMLTTTNRRLVDAVSFLPASAVTGGVDYDWRLGRRFGLNGYWAGSSVRGSTEAISLLQQSTVHSFQRPDASHVEFDPAATALNGHSGMLNFAKIGGERTRGNVTLSYRSPGFDVNDLGFMQRADGLSQNAWFQLRWMEPKGVVRERILNFNQWSHRNFDGDLISSGGNVNGNVSFTNLWSLGGGLQAASRAVDDRLTRGGPSGYAEGWVNSWQWFNTNDRKPVSFHWNSGWSRNADGGRGFDLSPSIQFRPGSAASAEIGISYAKNNDNSQWVGAVDGADRRHYVFGALRQRTSSMTLRVNYTLTPNLSLQVYGQPFVSAGRFESYKELVDGRAPYAARYRPFDYQDTADFKVLSFRTTNVMRWEYKPGSTLFVVWQRENAGFLPDGSFQFGRDYGEIFSSPSSNTFLVKLAYWFNP